MGRAWTARAGLVAALLATSIVGCGDDDGGGVPVDGGDAGELPSGPVCGSIEVGEGTYAPGDLIPIAGVPEGVESLEVALDFDGQLAAAQFYYFEEERGAFLFARPHPTDFTATHTPTLVVTVDGGERCRYPGLVEITGLPEADPALIDRLLDDLEGIVATGALGVDGLEPLREAELWELDPQNRMVRAMLDALDGPDNPNSLRRLLEGDAEAYDGAGPDRAYVAAALAHAGVPEALAEFRRERELLTADPLDFDFNQALPCDSLLPLEGASYPPGVAIGDDAEDARCWLEYGEITSILDGGGLGGIWDDVAGGFRTFFSLLPVAGAIDTAVEKILALLEVVLPQGFQSYPATCAGMRREVGGIEYGVTVPDGASTDEGVLFRYDATRPGQVENVSLVLQGGGVSASAFELFAEALEMLLSVIPAGKLLDKLNDFAGPKVRRFIRDTLGRGEWLDKLDELAGRARRAADDAAEYARTRWEDVLDRVSPRDREWLEETQQNFEDELEEHRQFLENALATEFASSDAVRQVLESIATRVRELTGREVIVERGENDVWVITIVPAIFRFDAVDYAHESLSWTGAPLRDPVFDLDDSGAVDPVKTGQGGVLASTTAFFPMHTGRGCLDVGVACPVVDVADFRWDRTLGDPSELPVLGTMPEEQTYCFTPRGVANVLDESLRWDLVSWDSVGFPATFVEFEVGPEYGDVADAVYSSPDSIRPEGLRFGVRATSAAEGVYDDPDTLRAECPAASQFALLELFPEWPSYESTCGCAGGDCECACTGNASASWATVDGRSGGGTRPWSSTEILLDEEAETLLVRHNGFELVVSPYTGSGTYTGYNSFGADRPDDNFDVRGAGTDFTYDFASSAPDCHATASFTLSVTQEGDCISGSWMASIAEDGGCICGTLPDCDPSWYGSGFQRASGSFSGSATVPCEGECEPQSDAELCARDRIECGPHTTTDRCGDARSVSCGECAEPGLCIDNACCTPPTDEELCDLWSAECGTLTTLDRCGQSREVECDCPGAGECRGDRCCERGTAEDYCYAASECGTVTVLDGCGDLTTFDCGSCPGGVCEGGTCCVFAEHLEDDANCNCQGPCASDETCNGGVCECDPAEHQEDDDDCGCMGPCGAGAACNGGRCVEVACGDGRDNDTDGPADCDDGDCAGAPGCSTLACATPGTIELDVPWSGRTAGHDADDALTSCDAFGGDAVYRFDPPETGVPYCLSWDTGSRASSATLLDGCDPLSAELACADASPLELVPDGPVRVQISADPAEDGGAFEAVLTAGPCP